ncbi:MAG TPA: hypothetical protein VFX21_07295 [Acidimicrobiia bacterium]|nr:hypothetical protein [Acidimicrobiia bacterium]
MTAGWSLARAELRARPWSALVIAVVGGLALGLALAGVAGARRGPAAWDDLVARFRASDFSVFPQDPERLDELEQTLAGSDAVAATSRSAFVLLGAVEADGTISDRGVAAGMVDIAGDRSVERPAVVRAGCRRPRSRSR